MRIKDLFIPKHVLISNSALACNRYNWRKSRVFVGGFICFFEFFCLFVLNYYLLFALWLWTFSNKKKKLMNELIVMCTINSHVWRMIPFLWNTVSSHHSIAWKSNEPLAQTLLKRGNGGNCFWRDPACTCNIQSKNTSVM